MHQTRFVDQRDQTIKIEFFILKTYIFQAHLVVVLEKRNTVIITKIFKDVLVDFVVL